MFRNREDAALQLARRLRTRELHQPLILAIPRGGVVLGAVLARELDAELDIVLAHKLRHPGQLEFALGAISEAGEVYLTPHGEEVADQEADYLVEECRHQTREMARRRELYALGRPTPSTEDRTVIVVDDGIATAATMIAALKMLRSHHHGTPRELLVAVPVGAPEGVKEVRAWCDDVICLLEPTSFWAVGQFYQNFRQVTDEEVIELLQSSSSRAVTR